MNYYPDRDDAIPELDRRETTRSSRLEQHDHPRGEGGSAMHSHTQGDHRALDRCLRHICRKAYCIISPDLVSGYGGSC